MSTAKLKHILKPFGLLALLTLIYPSPVFAQNGCQYDVEGVVTIRSIICIFQNFLGLIPGLLILAALVMVIFAGARMILGADNPKEFEGAKNTLLFAIIGIFGLAIAWIILRLIQTFTGANVTELNF